MPIEEAGGYCDYCQKPVLGRRQGVNHVLYAILTIFSCGIWGLVWFLQVAFGGGDYACPNCGGQVRAGARGPLPPPDPNAPALPVSSQRKRFLLALVLALAAVWTIGVVIALVSTHNANKREATPLVFPSPSIPPSVTAVAPEIVLTDSKEHQPERIAAFHRVLADQSRDCGKIASARMKRRGAFAVWTVTCSPAKSYVLEYNAKGDLVGASALTLQ